MIQQLWGISTSVSSSSEHFALPRLRPRAAGADIHAPVQLTDVSVFLVWFGGATRFVHYGAAPLRRLPGVRRALDKQAQRRQRGRAEPGTGQASTRM